MSKNKSATSEKIWWKEATVYQLYPSSFCDSNGDGIGDLNGIYSKLDYLGGLGVDLIWLNPIYKSPQKDMGYDVSDYRDIDPRYGCLDDWDRLVEGLHARGIKLMMDLVVNHTSDEHEWFKESRKSKTSPKRDWYIWRPPKYDGKGQRRPPNNWRSHLQGSVWEWDEDTQEYFFHLYLPAQPDLNWENPVVRNEIWNLMRFWLDCGCDGFRMDVINFISKVQAFPDAPIVNPDEEYQPAPMYYANGPRVHEYLQEMHREVLSKYKNVISVGQASYTRDMGQLARYVLPGNKEPNMVFQAELMELDAPGKSRNDKLQYRQWKLKELKEVVNRWQTFETEEGFWNTVFISNHDTARCVSRFGNDSSEWRDKSAKLLAMMEVGQRGTLFIFQGDEIGMVNAPRSWPIVEYKDVATQRIYDRILRIRREEQGIENPDMSDVMDGAQRKARDHARLPMQWNKERNAGFSEGIPWMRVNDDYKAWNVLARSMAEDSVLAFWKKVLRIRRDYDVLVYGTFELLAGENEAIFAFQRTLDERKVIAILNFSTKNVAFSLPLSDFYLGMIRPARFDLLVSNYGSIPDSANYSLSGIIMRPYEGRFYLSTGYPFVANCT